MLKVDPSTHNDTVTLRIPFLSRLCEDDDYQQPRRQEIAVTMQVWEEPYTVKAIAVDSELIGLNPKHSKSLDT